MALIDEVRDLKQQGYDDETIIRHYQEEGIPPKEINDAVSQLKIKSAVDVGGNQIDAENSGVGVQEADGGQAGFGAGERQTSSTQGMQPSISDNSMNQNFQQIQQTNSQEGYSEDYSQNRQQAYASAPVAGGIGGQEGYGANYGAGYGYTDYNQGYGQEQNYGYAEYQPDYGGYEMDNINEIAEQVVAEKMADVLKKVEDLSEFRARVETRVFNIDDRLQKIEAMIDSLQSSVVRKIGNYVQDVQDIKSELSAMENSFSKVVSPLADNIKELERISKKPVRKTSTRKTTAKKASKSKKAKTKNKGGRPRKKPKSMVR